MATSAVDAIAPAFEHTKQQLLQPFQLSQWAKLALVGCYSVIETVHAVGFRLGHCTAGA